VEVFRRRRRIWRFRRATRKLRKIFRPIFEERSRGFEEVGRVLESRGWTFTSAPGGAAPVQASGKLPSGEAFYLRCRGDICTLRVRADVDPESTELIREPDWDEEWAREGWGMFDASWAEPADVLDALTELETRHRTRDLR
jgi:hypothetical protein